MQLSCGAVASTETTSVNGGPTTYRNEYGPKTS